MHPARNFPISLSAPLAVQADIPNAFPVARALARSCAACITELHIHARAVDFEAFFDVRLQDSLGDFPYVLAIQVSNKLQALNQLNIKT